MLQVFFRSVALSILLAATSPAVQAARPLVTDDARVVDPDGCQIESFVRRQRDYSENEFWLLPACNPGGHAELTLGGMRTQNGSLGQSSSTIAQAKFLLRPITSNNYGTAVSVGVQNSRPFASDGPTKWNPYVNLIGSQSLLDDRLFLHINLGASHNRDNDLTTGLWGLASEIVLTPRLIGILEAFGQSREKANRHVGLRVWIIPDKLQLDGTYGYQPGNTPEKRWNSLGIRILF